MLGQYLGIGALVAASVAVSLLSLLIPSTWLPWLGLLPLLLGLKLLLENRTDAPASAPASGLVPIIGITIANGADNMAVYVPLFAARNAYAIATMAVVFAVMLALWCAGARALVNHPAAGAPLRRWGPGAVPWVLIGIGVWILLF